MAAANDEHVDPELGRALNDDDINILKQKVGQLSKGELDRVNEIYRRFSNATSTIMTMAMKQAQERDLEEDETRDEREGKIVQLERMRRILNSVPSEESFLRAHGKVWGARQHILKSNASYFLERDYSKIIKEDSNQTMIESLIDIVKETYDKLTKEQQAAYWKQSQEMLRCVAEFKQMTKDIQL